MLSGLVLYLCFKNTEFFCFLDAKPGPTFPWKIFLCCNINVPLFLDTFSLQGVFAGSVWAHRWEQMIEEWASPRPSEHLAPLTLMCKVDQWMEEPFLFLFFFWSKLQILMRLALNEKQWEDVLLHSVTQQWHLLACSCYLTWRTLLVNKFNVFKL